MTNRRDCSRFMSAIPARSRHPIGCRLYEGHRQWLLCLGPSTALRFPLLWVVDCGCLHRSGTYQRATRLTHHAEPHLLHRAIKIAIASLAGEAILLRQ
jgi:hypothetical protein